MAHTVNRNAFLAAKGCGQPLLSAYGQLVATELALKDHTGTWGRGHDVPRLIDNLNDAGLTALCAQLRLSLASLPCTTIQGTPATVRVNAYPDMRYTRHSNDYAGGTTDAHLQNLVQTIDDIIVQLRLKGIPV